MRRAAFFVLVMLLSTGVNQRAAFAESNSFFSGFRFDCTEQGERFDWDWTAKCTHPRIRAQLFMLESSLSYYVPNIIELFALAEVEERVDFAAYVVADSLAFRELAPPRQVRRDNPEPGAVFGLPSHRDAFCQFGYIPEMERPSEPQESADWRRFRCYYALVDGFVVIDFTPDGRFYPTSYFVNLIDVILTR